MTGDDLLLRARSELAHPFLAADREAGLAAFNEKRAPLRSGNDPDRAS